jgi:methyl-accepting chemotaxis protein
VYIITKKEREKECDYMQSKWHPKSWWLFIKRQKGLIRTKLVAAFLAILIIPGVVIGFYSYDTAKNEVRDKITNGTKSSISLIEGNVEQFIKGANLNLDALTDIISLYSLDGEKEAIEDLVENFVKDKADVISATVGLSDGTYFGTPTNNESGFDPREEEWFKSALDSDGTAAMSDVVQSSVSGDWVVRLSKALPNNQGVVKVSIGLSSIVEAVQHTKLGDTGTMAVLDKSGNIVTGVGFIFDSGDINQGENFAIMSGNAGKDGEVSVTEIDLTMLTELYETVNTTSGWTVTGLIALDDYNVAAAPIFKVVSIVLVISAVIGLALLVFTLRSIFIPLNELSVHTRSVRDGNLNEHVKVKRRDEIGLLAEDFNEMTNSLRTVVEELSQTSSLLTGSSQSIKISTEETTKAVEEVVNTIQDSAETSASGAMATEETAEAVNEMAKGIQSISDSVQAIVQTVNQTDGYVNDGSETVSNVQTQMGNILAAVEESAEMITKLSDLSNEAMTMNSAIGNISQQTNLLSLNASIEAARSGEHGKGFAVVANEILKLSDQSKEVADGIDSTIISMIEIMDQATKTMQGNVQQQLNQGIQISNEVGSAFTNIEESTKQIVQQIQEISGVSERISQGTQQVIDNVNGLENITKLAADSAHTTSASAEEQMAAMEEISASTEQLSDMAVNLEDLVKRFTL